MENGRVLRLEKKGRIGSKEKGEEGRKEMRCWVTWQSAYCYCCCCCIIRRSNGLYRACSNFGRRGCG